MVQTFSISEARKKLSQVVDQVLETNKPVLIIRDSVPSVMVYPYKASPDKDKYLASLMEIDGDWFDETDYKQMRKQVEERLAISQK